MTNSCLPFAGPADFEFQPAIAAAAFCNAAKARGECASSVSSARSSEDSEAINGQLFGVRGGEVLLYSAPDIDRQILSFGRRFTLNELDELMPRTLGLVSPQPILA